MGQMPLDTLRVVVEALIFAADEPISLQQLQEAIEDTTPQHIREAVTALNREYSQTGHAFQIVEVAGGYQMVTRESYTPWLRKHFQKKMKVRLSQAALETLAIIAFKQPISRTEIDAIRGVNSDGVVRTLLERKLITLAGRGDGPGRPLLYKTTREFLRYFGINDVSELPKPREIEDLLKEDKRPEGGGTEMGDLFAGASTTPPEHDAPGKSPSPSQEEPALS